jgi:hypothetical protein
VALDEEVRSVTLKPREVRYPFVESKSKRSFNALVEEFLGSRLPETLADTVSLHELSAEARGVVVRMLALMKRAAYPLTEFNPHLLWLLSKVTPAMLPPAWGGRIPPVTAPGRHTKLDRYAARNVESSSNRQPVFIDIGCGFPPVTTVDTARYLPDWSVIGVDRSIARYVVYDAQGDYACFNRDGKFQYFQPRMKPLHDNPKAAKDRFTSLFEDLSSRLKVPEDETSQTVEKNGNRLLSNPVRNFETENLKFIESEIEDLQLPPATVIRCMNVLLYFERRVRERLLTAVGALLDDAGILISGFNHPFGIYARYAVYTKNATGIAASEFAFSPDNLRPLGIGPWLTLQEQDEEAELLADLTGAVRADPTFWPEFNRCVDALQAKLGICRRGDDGFNHFTQDAQTALPRVIMERVQDLWHRLDAAGYTDGAIGALWRAGYTAWKNPVGDIAVLPPEGSLPRFR